MATKRSPARLVIALSIAAALAVFLLYTSIAGGGTPSLRPSQLGTQTGEVAVADSSSASRPGMLTEAGSGSRCVTSRATATVPVVYTGSVPDLFRSGRDVVVNGRLQNGVLVATPGSLVTKCPSKYTAAKPASQ